MLYSRQGLTNTSHSQGLQIKRDFHSLSAFTPRCVVRGELNGCVEACAGLSSSRLLISLDDRERCHVIFMGKAVASCIRIYFMERLELVSVGYNLLKRNEISRWCLREKRESRSSHPHVIVLRHVFTFRRPKEGQKKFAFRQETGHIIRIKYKIRCLNK